MNRGSRMGLIYMMLAALGASCTQDPATNEPVTDAAPCTGVDQRFESSFDTVAKLVQAETYRTEGFTNEEHFVTNMQSIVDQLNTRVKAFNVGQKRHLIEPWEWKVESNEPAAPKYYWIFGFRLGSGARKIALNAHFDTVSPGSSDAWQPFVLGKSRGETKHGGVQELWVGRGAVDDKGPALATLLVLENIARAYDASPLLDEITVELIFDTTEEVGSMSMQHYREANVDAAANLEVIFDTFWAVRAEKGVERPVFSLPREQAPRHGIWVESLDTPPGSINQIADQARAVLRSDSPDALQDFADRVAADYASYQFDDTSYRPATLIVDSSGLPDELTLVTQVAGAQHASVPQENRETGANPLVSLANYLAGLSRSEVIADNDVARMCRFIESTWGTYVFGEKHPDLLQRSDSVFSEGNGTTYALTRLYSDPAPGSLTLSLDIRYAIGHHSQPWDGVSEGLLCGTQSTFQAIFEELVDDFNDSSGGPPISFQTVTRVAPDVRRTDGPTFARVSQAYERVTGMPAPAVAMGAGTDAKGTVKAIAAGALFDTTFGAPVNYHGIREAVPVRDLALSTKILCNLVDGEIRHAEQRYPEPVTNSCSSSP